MNRRSFLQLAYMAVLGTAGRQVAAALLPSDPFFGRSFTDMAGKETALSSFQGQPLLVNFWASWCAPCLREMPLLESLHQENPQLTVLGLAIDTRANVQRFLDKVQVSYPLLLTGSQGIPLMRELGNTGGGLPFTVLYDRRGRESGKVIGELQEDDIQKRIKAIL